MTEQPKPTREQLSVIRRLAGGSIKASQEVRTAAHNIIIGAADDNDYEIIQHYGKTNTILAE